MARQTRLERRERNRRLVLAIEKHWSSIGTVIIAGQTYTPDAIVQRLRSLAEAHDRTDLAYAEYLRLVAAEKQLAKEVAIIATGVEKLAFARVRKDSAELADFGVGVGKPGPKTLASKVQMVEKAAATRAQRGGSGTSRKRRRR